LETGLSLLLPGYAAQQGMKCREDVWVEGRQPTLKVLRQFVPCSKTPGCSDKCRYFGVCTQMCTLLRGHGSFPRVRRGSFESLAANEYCFLRLAAIRIFSRQRGWGGARPSRLHLATTVASADVSGNGDTAKLAVAGFCWGGRTVWFYAARFPYRR
jgi:hypothetical protein